MTRPQLDLRCVDKDGIAPDIYMGVSYLVRSYYFGGEIDTMLSAVEQILIPIITGQAVVSGAPNYIDESIVGDYLIYNINTYLQ